MKKPLLFTLAAYLFLSLPAAQAAATKKYDGIITQINLLEGTLGLRLRDGSSAIVKLPFETGMFLNITGVLDGTKNILDSVTGISVKSATSSDAIPTVSRISPGAGITGDKITIFGTGFTRKGNSVAIDGINNAAINIPSKDGQSITFGLPPMPCDQKVRLSCSGAVIRPGEHTFVISNTNGKSNPTPFTVNPLPPLTINTEVLPQGVSGTKYEMTLAGSGGSATYSWKISSGQLPRGMILKQGICFQLVCRSEATLYGIPFQPGIYTFSISLSSGPEVISRDYTLTVNRGLNLPVY